MIQQLWLRISLLGLIPPAGNNVQLPGKKKHHVQSLVASVMTAVSVVEELKPSSWCRDLPMHIPFVSCHNHRRPKRCATGYAQQQCVQRSPTLHQAESSRYRDLAIRLTSVYLRKQCLTGYRRKARGPASRYGTPTAVEMFNPLLY